MNKVYRTKCIVVALSVLVVMCTCVPVVAWAATGKFDSNSKFWTVTTQAEADALPSNIDATGYDIAVFVDGDDIILSGLTITGVWGYKTYNIVVDGRSDVEVRDCVLDGAFVSILYYQSSGKIRNNVIGGYEKNGITVNDPSADGKNVRVMDNFVTGMGPVGPGSWAQNGIQIGYGARAVVTRNTVNGNWYTGADWGASGILIFEASDNTIEANTLTNNEFGIAIETWSWFVAAADNNKVICNTITNGYKAVSIAAYDVEGWFGPGYTMDDPTADNNKVANNIITDQDIGIGLTSWDSLTTNSYVTSADNNKLVRNSFTDVDVAIELFGDTTTKIPPYGP